jgi:hypothetical protein
VKHPVLTRAACAMATMLLLSALPSPARAQVPKPRAEASISTPRPYLYVGEEIPLTLRLVTRDVDVSALELVGMPKTPYMTISEQFATGPVERRREGSAIAETRTYRTRVKAHTPGTTIISPTLKLDLLITQSSSFFTQQNTRYVRLKIKPLPLEVRPLPPPPQGIPATDAIGALEFDISLSTTNVAVGDLITVRTELRGDGNILDIPLPELTPGPRFRVYPPRQLKAEPTHRIQEQIIVPQSTNATTIAALTFSWFDSPTERYQLRTFGPYTLGFHEQQTIIAGIFRPPSTANATPTNTTPNQQQATTRPQTSARLAPSHDAAELFVIPAGATIQKIRTYNDWQTIEYLGRRGWIPTP